ncbi:MAG: glycoside hydrolase family 3 C-terminal domain-containing protein [Massilia sp.]
MHFPPRLRQSCLALQLLFCASAPALAQEAPPCSPRDCAFLDASKTVEQRAADLVARLTLQEKAEQMGNTTPAIARLGVPKYFWWNEGLHGVARAGFATVFPQAIGMAASWNPALMQRVGDVISTEFRAKYVANGRTAAKDGVNPGLNVWSPNINIFRDPRWGRGQETYGEDPYLTGKMAIGFINGLQGNDSAFFKTVATAKHFAVHSGPESNRHAESVFPSPHDLEDTYLPAFRAAVVDGKVDSIMCAYNAVNGVPACASDDLMAKRLRQDWGFKGFVVSDCGAAANIYRGDSLHYTKTPEEAVAIGITAGMDLICGDYRNRMTTEVTPIVNAVQRGLLPEATLNRALERLFAARIRLGMFESPAAQPFAQIGAADNDTPAHRALSLTMARESMVLLKNNGVLPLKKEPRTIAVIGPNADSYDSLVGNYNGKPSAPVTVLDGMRARFPHARIVHVQGSGLVGPAEVAVPDQALCTDAQCAQPGLKMEQFAGDVSDAAPAETRSVKNAQVSWNGADHRTTTRWIGYVTAPASGAYQLRFQSEGGYRIWIDGKLVCDEWRVIDTPSVVGGTVSLVAGQRHAIRVEATQRGLSDKQVLLWSPPGDGGREAVRAARNADLVVFVGGLSARLEGEERKVGADGFAGGDRTSLDLPAPQEQLLKRLHGTGKPVVLVLINGSALALNWAERNVAAIIEAWYPGGEGGHAVAGLIAGDFSPAGRLPVTFYQSADQLPGFSDYRMAGRTYRYFKGDVLYPFGYGLSYTSFAYATPALSASSVQAGEAVTLSVQVRNTGKRAGDEVVQLYVAKPGEPANPTLGGFARVHLKPGERQAVQLKLDARALSQVDEQGVRSVQPGRYTLSVGGGQPRYAKAVAATLWVAGRVVLPK